jgi:hypothetical protein
MEPLSPRDRSRLLREASNELRNAARKHVQSAQKKLDRARNTLQVVWLLRELRRRRQRDA